MYNKNPKNNNLMIGSSIFMRNKIPQVITLTNEILNYINLSNYVWLEKTDGERKIVKIQNGILSEVKYDNTENEIRKIGEVELYIFDTELYDNKYNIFDVMFIKSKDITNLNYKIRMSNAKEFVKKYNDIFELKQYNSDVNITYLLNFVDKTYINPKTNHIIDGIILQNIPLNYYNTKSYKLKKLSMNTIDFLLKKIDDKKYLLYSMGNKDLFSNLHSEISIEKETFMNENKLMFLFNSPLFPNTYYFDYLNYCNPEDHNLYFPEQIEQINKMLKNNDFDNKIVEMSFTGKRYYPLRIREDKIFPNRFNVCLNNLETIFSPITGKKSYFHHKTTSIFNENIINIFHESNRTLRKCIIEKFINKNNFSCIDLAGGRGADSASLYNNGCFNIFAVDSDSDALIKYVNKVYSEKFINNYKNIFPDWISKKPENLFINAIHKILSSNNDNIVYDIKSRYEWKNNKDGVDVILMNYAIHYICDDIKKIQALNNFKNKMLNKNGIFIFTYFDGDMILNYNKNIVDIGPFKIKITEDKKYAYMPLPTIDESGYRKEPLVTNELLENLDGNYKEIKVYDEFIKYVENLEYINEIKDYLKLIKLRIYGNKNNDVDNS